MNVDEETMAEASKRVQAALRERRAGEVHEEGIRPSTGRKFLLATSLIFLMLSLTCLAVQMRLQHHFVPHDIIHIAAFFICTILYLVLYFMTRYVGAFDISIGNSLYDGKNMMPLTLLITSLSMTMYGVAISFVDYTNDQDLFYSQLIIAQGILIFIGTALLYWRGYLMSREERRRRRKIDKVVCVDYDSDDNFEDYA